jgi:formate hydrogenlyase subunit 4
MLTLVSKTIHVLLVLGLPPLLAGVIAKTKALFAGRVGPPLLQPYYDLLKLFRKGSVFSPTTTRVFRAGPVVGLATAVMAALMIPLVDGSAPISFTGDMILLAYLLGLGRFFTWTPARRSKGWAPLARSPSPAWPSPPCSWACSCWRN